jgi:glucokinase
MILLCMLVWGSGYDLDVKICLWTWRKTTIPLEGEATEVEAGTTNPYEWEYFRVLSRRRKVAEDLAHVG